MKKTLFALGLCMALVLPLSACSPTNQPNPEPDPEPDPHPIKVTVTVGDESKSKSFDTLEEVLPKIKKQIDDSNQHIKVTVALAEGVYPLTKTAELSYAALADKDYELSFVGAGADKTVITSELVTNAENWSDEGGGIYSFTLPDEYLNEDDEYPILRDLYLDGEALEFARTEMRTFRYDLNMSSSESPFLIDSDLLDGISQQEADGLELWVRNFWNMFCFKIRGYGALTRLNGEDFYPVAIDESNFQELTAGGTSHAANANEMMVEDAYWLVNRLEFLTEPNTFVYDRETGTFYVKTDGSDIADHTLTIPLLTQLFSLDNVENLTFDGIGFTGTTANMVTIDGYVRSQAGMKWGGGGHIPEAAIHGKDVENVTVQNCAFYQLGYDGISLYGKVEGLTIKNNSFEHIASGAIRLGAASMESGPYQIYLPGNYTLNALIENNYILYNAEEYWSSAAIQIFFSNNCKILHNTILHTSYSAIHLGWVWATNGSNFLNIYKTEVAYNYIEDFMAKMMDGGAIYCIGGNAGLEIKDYFNFMHDNYAVVTENAGDLAEHPDRQGYFFCWYLDNCSSNWKVYNNVIWTLDETHPIENSLAYIYYQHISSDAQTHNNHSEYNYFINIVDEHHVFNDYVRADCNLTESNNYSYPDLAALNASAQAATVNGIVTNSGCTGHNGAWPQN